MQERLLLLRLLVHTASALYAVLGRSPFLSRQALDPLEHSQKPKAIAYTSLCYGTLHAGTKPDYILNVPCASILGSPRPYGL